MKRKKAPKEVLIDISENFQPTTTGFKSSSFAALKAMKPRSVDALQMNGVLEQVEGEERIKIMRAVYRVLKPGGRAMATVAHWTSTGASMSPYSKWPPFSAEFFGFFSADVRKRSGYKNPGVEDIDFDVTWQEIIAPEWQAGKSDAARAFAIRHYNNVVLGMHMTLVKKGK